MKLTSDTVISVGFIPILMGFCFWLTTIYFKADANEKKLNGLPERIARIEERLDIIYEKVVGVKYEPRTKVRKH